MDREALLDSLPDKVQFAKLNSAGRQASIEQAIVRILDAIESERREPSDWEAYQLAHAIGSTVVGWYYLAITCVINALADPKDVSENLLPLGDDVHRTVAALRKAMWYLAGVPARNG